MSLLTLIQLISIHYLLIASLYIIVHLSNQDQLSRLPSQLREWLNNFQLSRRLQPFTTSINYCSRLIFRSLQFELLFWLGFFYILCLCNKPMQLCLRFSFIYKCLLFQLLISIFIVSFYELGAKGIALVIRWGLGLLLELTEDKLKYLTYQYQVAKLYAFDKFKFKQMKEAIDFQNKQQMHGDLKYQNKQRFIDLSKLLFEVINVTEVLPNPRKHSGYSQEKFATFIETKYAGQPIKTLLEHFVFSQSIKYFQKKINQKIILKDFEIYVFNQHPFLQKYKQSTKKNKVYTTLTTILAQIQAFKSKSQQEYEYLIWQKVMINYRTIKNYYQEYQTFEHQKQEKEKVKQFIQKQQSFQYFCTLISQIINVSEILPNPKENTMFNQLNFASYIKQRFGLQNKKILLEYFVYSKMIKYYQIKNGKNICLYGFLKYFRAIHCYSIFDHKVQIETVLAKFKELKQKYQENHQYLMYVIWNEVMNNYKTIKYYFESYLKRQKLTQIFQVQEAKKFLSHEREPEREIKNYRKEAPEVDKLAIFFAQDHQPTHTKRIIFKIQD